MARIPTEPDVSPVSSAGSSHSRLTSAEDNEEALLFAMPSDRSFGQGEFKAVGKKRKSLIFPASNAGALWPRGVSKQEPSARGRRLGFCPGGGGGPGWGTDRSRRCRWP